MTLTSSLKRTSNSNRATKLPASGSILTNERSPFEPPRFVPQPAIGGHIGPEPQHFIVDEIPAYPLSGEGEHLFLKIQKTGLNTIDVVKRIARSSGIRDRDIGYAGMKDKQAITTQWFSLTAKDEDVDDWDLGEGVTILERTRHRNKLRTGHLIGNRFAITLVGVPEGAETQAKEIAGVLKEKGLPNYFGPQRFGRDGKNLEQALAWLQNEIGGAPSEEQAPPEEERKKSRRRKKGRGGRFENKMFPSVIQSEIFNRYAAKRLGMSEPLLLGEIVRLDQAAKCFVVEDLEKELPRRLEGDLHLTGPMPGPKTLQALNNALSIEESIFEDLALDQELRTALEKSAPGARRDLVLYPENLEISSSKNGELTLSFSLPAGAYATQLVREFSGASWMTPRA